MSNKHKDRPVVVADFINPNEAHIFKGLLISEGIEAFIYHEHSAIYTPVGINAVRVAVREKDLGRAKLLLQEIENQT